MNQVARKLENALTVRELIECLENLPDNAVVLFTCDYGDHCHTEQALPVSHVDQLSEPDTIVESGYSHSGLKVRRPDGNGDYIHNDPLPLPVVVLS